jgi:hypothetical protein
LSESFASSLSRIVSSRGPSILAQEIPLRGLLSDYAPTCKRQSSALLLAVREKVVREIVEEPGPRLTRLRHQALVRRLVDTCGLDPALSEEVLSAVEGALGKAPLLAGGPGIQKDPGPGAPRRPPPGSRTPPGLVNPAVPPPPPYGAAGGPVAGGNGSLELWRKSLAWLLQGAFYGMALGTLLALVFGGYTTFGSTGQLSVDEVLRGTLLGAALGPAAVGALALLTSLREVDGYGLNLAAATLAGALLGFGLPAFDHVGTSILGQTIVGLIFGALIGSILAIYPPATGAATTGALLGIVAGSFTLTSSQDWESGLVTGIVFGGAMGYVLTKADHVRRTYGLGIAASGAIVALVAQGISPGSWPFGLLLGSGTAAVGGGMQVLSRWGHP